MNFVDLCTHCPNMAGGPIFYEGNPSSICWVAEALGEQEVKLGRPLIGPSGQVFNSLLAEAGIKREEQFLMNTVSCRPPMNQIDSGHIHGCQKVRESLIKYCSPKVIVALGSVAMKALLKTTSGVINMRGKVESYKGIPVVITLHPSFIMRKEAEAKAGDRVAGMFRKSVISDFLLAKKISTEGI